MILIGITKPKVFYHWGYDCGRPGMAPGWRIAYSTARADTSEPGIYRIASTSPMDLPVDSWRSGIMAAQHLAEMHRVFPVETELPWL